MNDVETRDLTQFIDLLERCLTLNPDKRITPLEALKHPFFSNKAVPFVR
jgi:serine/threonine-protein kinase PRP4